MPRDELLLGPPNIHILSILIGPTYSPPYSAPKPSIVLTAVQVYIVVSRWRSMKLLNDELKLYTDAIGLHMAGCIYRIIGYHYTWRLIKDI